MQLDKTQIAIRERGLLEIYDLALLVTKSYWKPILVSLLLLGLPITIINYLILSPLLIEIGVTEVAAQYILLTVILVYLESPFVSIPLTLFLGDALFHDKPDWKRALLGVGSLLSSITWCILLLRGVLPGMLLGYFCLQEDGELAGFILVMLVLLVVVLRVVRPYLGEIVLLERNPLTSKTKNTITISRRSSTLHTPNFGELVVRGMASVVSLMIATAVILNIWAIRGYIFGFWSFDFWFLNIYLPFGLWLVVGFMSVVRFLSYLDLRIRREGWEVELVVRAEANRWKEAFSG